MFCDDHASLLWAFALNQNLHDYVSRKAFREMHIYHHFLGARDFKSVGPILTFQAPPPHYLEQIIDVFFYNNLAFSAYTFNTVKVATVTEKST